MGGEAFCICVILIILNISLCYSTNTELLQALEGLAVNPTKTKNYRHGISLVAKSQTIGREKNLKGRVFNRMNHQQGLLT